MPKFLALTSKGLEPALAEELKALEFRGIKEIPMGVEFESNWEGCYRANYLLRTATRVVLPILDFHAYQPDDLYNNLRKHDFTKYIEPNQTLSVDGKTRLSNTFRDQRFLVHKTKDAIVDQFRDKFGERPNVDSDNPDLRVMVRVVKSSVSVAIDTSGESLAFHGYRQKTVMAPMREHLAAGLVRLSGWTPEQPLVDPMCGSGTLLIEAALMAQGLPAARLRQDFGFMHLKNYQESVWNKIKGGQRARGAQVRIFGYDRNREAIEAAKLNARRAGVSDLITFAVADFKDITAPAPSGVMLTNPPYGERLGEVEKLKIMYADFASVMKRTFKGWTCWLISGSDELTAALHLKAERRIPVFNGNLECRFLKYPMH